MPKWSKCACVISAVSTSLGDSPISDITASGDASLRLVAGKTVQEINTALVPSWDKIDPKLRDR